MRRLDAGCAEEASGARRGLFPRAADFFVCVGAASISPCVGSRGPYVSKPKGFSAHSNREPRQILLDGVADPVPGNLILRKPVTLDSGRRRSWLIVVQLPKNVSNT